VRVRSTPFTVCAGSDEGLLGRRAREAGQARQLWPSHTTRQPPQQRRVDSPNAHKKRLSSLTL